LFKIYLILSKNKTIWKRKQARNPNK